MGLVWKICMADRRPDRQVALAVGSTLYRLAVPGRSGSRREERPRRSSFQTTRGVAGVELVQDLLEVARSVRAPLAVSVNTQ